MTEVQKTKLREIYESADNLKRFLRERNWPPLTYMLIPSVLKSADEKIEFLEGVSDKKASELCKELIDLRRKFHEDIRMKRKINLKDVTRSLLKNRTYDDGFWPGLKKGKSTTKKAANQFLLACILDYQIPAEQAWANARRLVEDEFGNPNDLWETITKFTKSEWNKKFKRFSLHRFPKAHERVWRIGGQIVELYKGDARNIWKKQQSDKVLERLLEMKVGEQISRMIVGALNDTKQIQGCGDVKVDIHVRRVLGRIIRGKGFSNSETSEVINETRAMYPKNPWLLDSPLYLLGKYRCTANNPNCEECYLFRKCTYSLNEAS